MATDPNSMNPAKPVLRVRGLSKNYRRRVAPLARSEVVVAAEDVGIEIFAGQTLALVGRSGSGKSTVARCVTRLEKPDAGEVWLEGTDIARLGSAELRPFRRKVQMVFQDAATSMNPRFTAAEIIEEPLLIQRQGDASSRRVRAGELMQEVGLSPQWGDRAAMEFSGGQQQRLAIARALALKPDLLVLDEALSGLDLSTEAQIVNLLLDLQAAHALGLPADLARSGAGGEVGGHDRGDGWRTNRRAGTGSAGDRECQSCGNAGAGCIGAGGRGEPGGAGSRAMRYLLRRGLRAVLLAVRGVRAVFSVHGDGAGKLLR